MGGRVEKVLTGGLPSVLSLNSWDIFVLFYNICEFILVYKDVLNYLPLRKNALERDPMFIKYPQHTTTYPQRYSDLSSGDLTQLYSPCGEKYSILYMLFAGETMNHED